MGVLPKLLKKYFWDVDFSKLNPKDSESFITERLLEYGDEKALRWLLKNVKKKTIKKILFEERALSLKSANFWTIYFKLPKDKILCLKKSYQKVRKSHWPY